MCSDVEHAGVVMSGRPKVGGQKVQVLLGVGVGERIDRVSANRGEFIRLAVLAALEVAEAGKRPVTTEQVLDRGIAPRGRKGVGPIRVVGPTRRDDAEAVLAWLRSERGGTVEALMQALGWLPMRVEAAVRLLSREGRVMYPRAGWMEAVDADR